MSPLYELTKMEGINIKNWGEPHQRAFELIIEKLTSAPVLAAPVLGQPFVVETDASKLALGAVLLQRNKEGKEQPIAYGSRNLTSMNPSIHPLSLRLLDWCLHYENLGHI